MITKRCAFLITLFVLLIVVVLFVFSRSAFSAEPIIIDHTCTDISRIPEIWINQAKSQHRVSYGHKSHGSQPVTGMDVIMNSNHLYDFNTDGAVQSGLHS